VGEAAIRIGVLGLGSVFYGPYMGMLERLADAGRVRVTAVYDSDEDKRRAAGLRLGVDPGLTSAEAVIENDDVDLVLVLTSMPLHGRLASAALAAGKHVLVEKPMATSLEEAAALLRLAAGSPGHLVCAPHHLLSPTFRAVRAHVEDGDIGRLLLARARYGWSGPDWGRWFYERGGGALFDLGVYNVTSLCGLLGSAQRVTAMAGVAIPERVVEGKTMHVQAEDNAHVLIDFGDARFASVTTGFTMQRYRSPAIELYGSDGVLQLLGDDWAPEGYELWRNSKGTWELFPERDPGWQWTEGLRHLVACIEQGREPVTRPEHAYHALEIMLAAQAAAADGRARDIASDFPRPDLSALAAEPDGRRVHDPRSALT
jgi:predicted dehydrogenase